MSDIAQAGLLLVPHIDKLEETIKRSLGASAGAAGASGEGLGRRAASGFGRGLASSGAAIGAFSAITSKAMQVVGGSISSAVSRFDTLNNFPRTMTQMGYSAAEAQSSIQLMSDRLQTMPTRLDDMATSVKGLSVITRDLGKATKAGLALNDMLIASGSNQQLVTSAMEQFRQILSKGKPEMQDWRSIMMAMPGQMDQLAKSMLGPTASANDLYAALGGGKNEATISMDQLLDAVIRLDEQGGEGFSSFREQAETAAGGVSTSASNMMNAVVKGVAGTMDAIGSQNITGVMNDIKSGINEAFKGVNSFVKSAMPGVKGLYDSLKPVAPQIATTATAFLAFSGVGGAISDAVGRVRELGASASALGKANALLGTSFTPVGLGIAAVSAVLAVGVTAFLDYQRKQENLTKATQGLSDVVSDTSALQGYSKTIDGVGEKSTLAAMGVDELAESTAKHIDTMRENTAKAEEQIAQLNTAQGIISTYAGQSDLSAEAQGKLKWALQLVNDQLGLNITSQDVQNGQYTDADGNVQNLVQSLGSLIEAKKEEARVTAITDNLTEAYKVKSDAAKTLAAAQNDYNDRIDWLVENGVYYTKEAARQAEADKEKAKALQSATEQYDKAVEAAGNLEQQLGDVAAAASDSADAFDAWGASADESFARMLDGKGGIDALKEDLRSLGASTEDLGKLSRDQLFELARRYDGTASSITSTLRDMGVSMGQTEESASALSDALAAMGDEVGTALSGSGVDVSEFSQRLAEAGVTAERLNQIGSENLAALAESCGGSMEQMTFFIQHYNDTPILDKDGNVQVDDASLIDAQGNVWTWNGSQIVDKDGNAIVEDQSLVDAQGNVWTWNGTNLQVKTSSGTVYDYMDHGIKQRDEWNREGLSDHKGSGTINIFENITRTISEVFGSKNAKGGIRLHADGGIKRRYHAGGAIATRAVPLDIVGEDGAEAIVPLTNRKYSQPFAEVIAEQIDKGPDAASRELLRAVMTLHNDLNAILGAIPEGMTWRDRVRLINKAVGASA